MTKDDMNPNEKRALVALLTQPSVTLAAESCGLSERTLLRYLADPAFKAELSRKQDALLSSITASLVGLASMAIEALRDILEDADATAAVKSRTALGCLSQMRQAIELADLAERVSRLEDAVP